MPKKIKGFENGYLMISDNRIYVTQGNGLSFVMRICDMSAVGYVPKLNIDITEQKPYAEIHIWCGGFQYTFSTPYIAEAKAMTTSLQNLL